MKEIIKTDNAPAAIGAYSQAIRIDNTVYISGQIPLIAETMKMVEGGFPEQANQVFKNLAAVVDAAGASVNDIVKLTVYMVDLGDFAELNSIMSDYVSDPFPARAAVEVAGLPKGALIEIDAILHLT